MRQIVLSFNLVVILVPLCWICRCFVLKGLFLQTEFGTYSNLTCLGHWNWHWNGTMDAISIPCLAIGNAIWRLLVERRMIRRLWSIFHRCTFSSYAYPKRLFLISAKKFNRWKLTGLTFSKRCTKMSRQKREHSRLLSIIILFVFRFYCSFSLIGMIISIVIAKFTFAHLVRIVFPNSHALQQSKTLFG